MFSFTDKLEESIKDSSPFKEYKGLNEQKLLFNENLKNLSKLKEGLSRDSSYNYIFGDGDGYLVGSRGDDKIHTMSQFGGWAARGRSMDNPEDEYLVLTDAGDGDDVVFAGVGNDEIWGGEGNDVIHGNAGNNLIVGGDGNDIIDGGNPLLIERYFFSDPSYDHWDQRWSVHRKIHGGNGDDVLTNADTMTGGDGRDTFVIDVSFLHNERAQSHELRDPYIRDFKDVGDKIIFNNLQGEMSVRNTGQGLLIYDGDTNIARIANNDTHDMGNVSRDWCDPIEPVISPGYQTEFTVWDNELIVLHTVGQQYADPLPNFIQI